VALVVALVGLELVLVELVELVVVELVVMEHAPDPDEEQPELARHKAGLGHVNV